jgi:hypothetical protein
MASIPLEQEDYKNNPDLLKAMIAVHLEDVIDNESQVFEIMEE